MADTNQVSTQLTSSANSTDITLQRDKKIFKKTETLMISMFYFTSMYKCFIQQETRSSSVWSSCKTRLHWTNTDQKESFGLEMWIEEQILFAKNNKIAFSI